MARVRAWIQQHGIRRLNVAGNRESKAPGISIRKVGEPDAEHPASPDDDAAVDEDVEPQASPEGRAATAEPVRRRSKNETMSPAQRRKARIQQRRQQRNNDE